METMIQQKQELVRMIESVNDPEILQAVKNLLNESQISEDYKNRMIEGALKSEEDYKAGRVYTREQVIERTSRVLNK
ncbi:MAG: hypothetical protein ACK5RG_10850 [Cyclobacteriaceae bacterium]|jgi:hypothetical protein|nr:hypothetical protein [Flammeovirgaceae bacterium]